MKCYQHILVATNLNDESRVVADKAKLMADHCGARLSVVHVMDYKPLVYGAGEFMVPLEGEIEPTVKKNVQETLAKEGKRLGIEPPSQWLEEGNTPEGLIVLINKLQIDLLVLGSHEHHGLGYLMRSVSNTIFHAMPCDILAVKITAKL